MVIAMSRKKLSNVLSLYLDDALNVREKNKLEAYLDAHPEAKKELEDLRAIKNHLSLQPRLKRNEWFWTSLSHKLERSPQQPENVLPFHRRFMPLAVPLSVTFAVMIGVGIFLQRDSLFKFYSEKKQQVQNVYESGIIQGKILPLFTNLSKDQVLQFALFGTLPLDTHEQTALRIDENKNSGYRIEIAKDKKRQVPSVTASEFYSALNMTPSQHQVVDSILGSAKEKIQSSVLVGENNSLAIHTELVNLNKVVMSNIAAALQPSQRVRFKQYLEARGAPFTFVANVAPPVAAQKIYSAINKAPMSDKYLVLTPDTICFSEIAFNMDSVRKNLEEALSSLSAIRVRTNAIVQQFGERDFAPPSGDGRFNVQSGADYFAVELQKDFGGFPQMPMYYKVVPRTSLVNRSDSAFSINLKQDSVMMRLFRHGIPIPPGSAQRSQQTGTMTQENPERHSIDLDSVIQDMSKRKPERRYRNPYEL
jgi:hypothetical protein